MADPLIFWFKNEPVLDNDAALINEMALENAGGKGSSLARMAAGGLPVPEGFCVSTSAYRMFVSENDLQAHIDEAITKADPADPKSLEEASGCIARLFASGRMPAQVEAAIVPAYAALPGENPAVAVRSSATTEDLPEASSAGQQESFLNVRGQEAVLAAVRQCWASLWTARAIGYRQRNGVGSKGEQVSLGVVVQRLVEAEAAGILFTANPLNGRGDQMLVNASWGLGEAVVGGQVTPDSLVLEASSGKVLERTTAHKRVHTVRAQTGTRLEETPAELQNAPVLSDRQAAQLADLGRTVEKLYGMPMDIEWTLARGEFALVQARPVTAMPGAKPGGEVEWKLPPGAYAAMRNNIVEMMTDPLTPLFQTFGLEAVNTSMNRILEQFLGGAQVLPDRPIVVVNEYAYYNGSVRFGAMFRLILDSGGILKRMMSGAVERWTDQGRPHYLEIVQDYERRRDESQGFRQLPARELLGIAGQLAEAAIDAYMALVSGVIPAAWMSEAWFTMAYRLVRRKGDPPAATYLMGFDSSPIQAEKSLYDLARWTREETRLAEALLTAPAEKLTKFLENGSSPDGANSEEWNAWRQRFEEHLRTYGHMVYNLDFGNPVPADDPTPLLETFQLFLRGEGQNPHERQNATIERREAAVQTMLERLKGRRLRSFEKNLQRAQKYAPLREDGLADVGLAYPLLRRALRELGRRMAEGGMISEAEDIFWLSGEEVSQAASRLDKEQALANLKAVIPARRAAWRAARTASPPMALFQVRLFGKDLVMKKGGNGKKQRGDTLKGVAASPGSVTARACVLHSPEDFGRMKTGDVLVASLTTPAWTPLFARAAAVVTDIGGPLSHGSIVAREYGIPAVLGTDSATARIQNGQTVTVDGDRGVVVLHY